MKDKLGLKCLYTNADQLMNKMEDLRSMIADDLPDIMIITEVIPKAQKHAISEALLNVDGFQKFTNFSFTEENLGASGRRGVVIYVNDKLETEIINIDTNHEDNLWVKVNLRNQDSLLCGCIYRTPAKEREKVIETTTQVCNMVTKAVGRNDTHVLICGDFNYPEIDWECEYVNSESIKPFIEVLQECTLHQHVCKPTRYREGQEPSLLDLILSTEEGMVHDLAHNPGLGDSDHECLNFQLACYKEERKDKPAPNYHRADYETIRNRLKDVDWAVQLRGNFHQAYGTFTSTLQKAMEGCIPNRLIGKKKKNMYLTTDAIRMKDRKNKLWRCYKRSGLNYHLARFRLLKNRLRSLTRRLRKNFEDEIAKDAKTAPKKFWSYVHSRTKTRSKIPILRGKDGTAAVTPLEKAETLNEFFSSVFTDENMENLPEDSDVYLGDYLNNFIITPEAVLTKLTNLNPGKTPGPDQWHPLFLKTIADLISLPLSILFQKSLNEGILPSEWLRACITAIHKKGEKGIADNYRPVSMTSIICKIMESLVRDKLVEHMVSNNLFSDSQHGFVPMRDCMTNLLTCIEKWSEYLEHGESVDVIYTDFAKAFDSVPHQRLLLKIRHLGICGNVLGWIRAFLSNRYQCVRVDDDYSGWKPVRSGIPQGSVLGPILFVIFINDMPKMVKNLCQLFADDAKLFCSVNLRDEEKNKSLQKDINALEAWSHKWQLPFNVEKCKCLHIGNINPCWRYKMSGRYLKDVKEEKDLGVLVDQELKFHRQTAAAVKKASSSLGLVKKTFASLDEKTFPLLFKSLVRPHLEYGNVIWGPFFKVDSQQVEKVQRRATKSVKGLKDLTYDERLRFLKLSSLQHRRRRGDMIMTYKIMTEKVNLKKESFFTLAPNQTNRGSHQYKLGKKKATKRTSLNVFSTRIINDWNSLPKNVIDATSTNGFKSKLDDHWSSKEYQTPFN